MSRIFVSCRNCIALPVLLCAMSLSSGSVTAATLVLCEGAGGVAASVIEDDEPAADSCHTVALPLAADDAHWWALSDIPLEGSVPAVVSLQGLFDTRPHRISEVIWTRPDAAAPAPAPATDDLVFDPAAAAQPRVRAGWFWSPALWRQTPELLWAVAAEQDLTRLYLTIPTRPGSGLDDAEELARFVMEAHARQLEVWAVIGDPRDVLDENRQALLDRSAAYPAYNRTVAAEARLDGLQLDIEPYLLPDFALAQEQWRDRYLAAVAAVHASLGGALPLDLVVPVWWGVHPAWGESLLQGLRLPALTLTVMNYRTDAARLRNDARPFLVWGQRHDMRVSIALETGGIGPDELRRTYVARGGSGHLWLLPVADRAVLILFGTEVSGLPGRSWRQQGETLVPATNITFAGDMQRLHEVLRLLEPEWLPWSAFAGIAIHGLEEATAAVGTPRD